ncbi:MAG: hypothetical protein GY796_04220 [Chloroflexi bacterium]|nr:hypothetical protein [Chloroflexota bacterium]
MDSFFGIGMPELILILVIAGIVMGPERIGRVARWLGKTTAQLQAISRGFVQQLQNEIDGIDDGAALKDAMSEVQSLRHELESLRTEFTMTTKAAVDEGTQAVEDIQHSIQPPILTPVKDDGQTAVSANYATAANNQSTSTPDLPQLLNVPDDPE